MTKKDLFISLRTQENLSIISRYLKRDEAYKCLIKYAVDDDWEGFDILLTEFLFEFSALSRLPRLMEKDRDEYEATEKYYEEKGLKEELNKIFNRCFHEDSGTIDWESYFKFEREILEPHMEDLKLFEYNQEEIIIEFIYSEISQNTDPN